MHHIHRLRTGEGCTKRARFFSSRKCKSDGTGRASGGLPDFTGTGGRLRSSCKISRKVEDPSWERWGLSAHCATVVFRLLILQHRNARWRVRHPLMFASVCWVSPVCICCSFSRGFVGREMGRGYACRCSLLGIRRSGVIRRGMMWVVLLVQLCIWRCAGL